LGLPVRLIGGPGQENDICRANQLIEGFKANAALADKGYDADALLQKLQKQDCKPVIPRRKTGNSSAATTKTSASSEISSSASSTSSNSSDGLQPAAANSLPTSWASSKPPLSPSGSNS